MRILFLTTIAAIIATSANAQYGAQMGEIESMKSDLYRQEQKLDSSSPNYYEERQRLQEQQFRLDGAWRALNDASTNWIVDGDRPQRR